MGQRAKHFGIALPLTKEAQKLHNLCAELSCLAALGGLLFTIQTREWHQSSIMKLGIATALALFKNVPYLLTNQPAYSI